MGANVVVFAERREGEIKRPVREALGVARRLADKLGGKVDVLALGPGSADVAGEVGAMGADRLFHVEASFAEHYAPELYAACLAEVAGKEDSAAVVLIPATSMGKDLAGRVTARLQSACASELIEVDVDADGTLRGTRPVYSGKALAHVSIPQARPAVATLRPNAFPAAGEHPGKTAEATALEPALGEDEIRVRVVRLEKAAKQELDVTEASIVCAGGRGLKEAKNFELVRELAEALGGAVGASRAVVDDGWIPHSAQVGQTGKVVSPNLYVACGISGAIQHLAGMSTSKVIVAINKDPEAPIFKVSNYGLVGDLFEILPAVTEAVRRQTSS